MRQVGSLALRDGARKRGRARKGAEDRKSAPERKQEILDAAIPEFARFGLHGTSVDAIAKRVGISQPYIFKLFGTKTDLFIAAASLVCRRIQAAFGQAAQAHPDQPLRAMGKAYEPLLSSRDELLVLLHAFAASADPRVGRAIRSRYRELWEFVAKASGASRAEVRDFFAMGMGLTVGSALGLQELFDHGEGDRECAP